MKASNKHRAKTTRKDATVEILQTVLRAALEALDACAEQAQENVFEWVAQQDSPLGRKRHCEATRRRIREGLNGASVVGRKHLLSPDALREELETLGRPRPKSEPTVSAGVEKLQRELRLVGGAL